MRIRVDRNVIASPSFFRPTGRLDRESILFSTAFSCQILASSPLIAAMRSLFHISEVATDIATNVEGPQGSLQATLVAMKITNS